MTSFFFSFFYAVVLVASSPKAFGADPPFAKRANVERVVLNALVERTRLFLRGGGYPEIPILEDAEFYRGLKRFGRVMQLREKIRTSPRRYETLGPITTMLFYTLIILLYVARVPIRILEKMLSRYATKKQSRVGKIDNYCTSTSIGSK